MADTPHLVVIGGGPAGVAGALAARARGAEVTVVERARLGGTCVHAGCIPSAALRHAAGAKRGAETAGRFGIHVAEVTTDWSTLQGWVGSVVKHVGSFSPFALEANGIPVVDSGARFVGPGHIEARDRCFEDTAVLIATGASAAPPALPGRPARPPLTNDGVMALDHAPARVVILGAGRFSIEWADFLRAMGSDVTVVYEHERILPTEDADLAGFLQLVLEERGVRFLLGTQVEAVDGDRVITAAGTHRADAVVCADERTPNTAGLGLDLAGVETTTSGAVIVDHHLRTTATGVFAAGDVTGPPWLTNRATAEGTAAARNVLGEAVVVDRSRVPRAVNTDPPLAAVGLTFDQAASSGRTVGLRMYDLTLSPRAISVGEPRGALKLVVDEDTGEILGGHMVGPDATEVIAQVVLAIDTEIEFQRLSATFDIHPSMSEAIAQAVRFGPA
jgi:dihydrolipoamide dehydrogenase